MLSTEDVKSDGAVGLQMQRSDSSELSHGTTRAGSSAWHKRPAFAAEVLRCASNLLSEFVFDVFPYKCLYSSQKTTAISLQGWKRDLSIEDKNPCLEILDVAMVGKRFFLCSKGLKKSQKRYWLAIEIPLILLMGLLTLPFAILRMAIKFVLLVPKILILRATDYFCDLQSESDKYISEEFAETAFKYAITSHLVKKCIDDNNLCTNLTTALQSHTLSELNASISRLEQYLQKKHLFGPGHFIYIALYHLAFTTALASVPSLLYKFDKLPNIIPHVPTLYLSLGLVALFSLTFVALNVTQCLKINNSVKEIFNLQSCTLVKDPLRTQAQQFMNKQSQQDMEDFLTQIKLLLQNAQKPDIEGVKALFLNELFFLNGIRKCADKIVTFASKIIKDDMGLLKNLYINQHVQNLLSMCESLRHGDNFGCDMPGLPMMDPYDGTTDIGFGAGALAIAPVASILRIIQIKAPFACAPVQQP